MKKIIIVAASAALLAIGSAARADYVVNLNGEMGSQRSLSFNDATRYFFYPYISVNEDASPTDAYVAFTDASNSFESSVNNPDPSAGGASSTLLDTTAQVVGNANSTWTMKIIDGPNTYDYEVDVAVALPFANLPSFDSPEMTNGNPYDGTISFSFTGGPSGFPGAGGHINAFIRGNPGLVTIDNAALPGTATSWTPAGDASPYSTVDAFLNTKSDALDNSSLSITAIRSLTSGAPGLSFNTPSLVYSSEVSATLTVPEPSSLALLVLAGLPLRRRPRVALPHR